MKKKSIIELVISCLGLFIVGFKIGQHQVQKEEKVEDVKKKPFRKYIVVRRS